MSSIRLVVGVFLSALGLHAVDASAQQVVCYAFSDGAQQLVGLQGSPWTSPPNPIYDRSISGLGLDAVESLYFDPANDRFYTVDQGNPQNEPDRFGYLDLVNGTFIASSPSLGSGTLAPSGTAVYTVGVGSPGQTTGLGRDPTTGYLWGVTLSGWLYRINIATGTIVTNAFGSHEFSRVRLPNGTSINSIEDITFDASGNMYVVTNSSGNTNPARIYRVDKSGTNPGVATLVSSITVNGLDEDEFEGLSFGPDGVLYATTGNGTMSSVNRSKMWRVDLNTGVATKLFDLPTVPSPVD